MKFIWGATEHFRVAVFSSRTNQPGGLLAMQDWFSNYFTQYWRNHASQSEIDAKIALIEWPTDKPSAFLTIDDRAITFDGTWPSYDKLKKFKPWNKLE
jgi:hypothetical protein